MPKKPTYKELDQRIAELEKEIFRLKQAEKILAESEATYKSVFENAGTAMTIIEEDKTICMANPEFEKLSGYSRQEIEGKMMWTRFVVPKYLEDMKKFHLERRGAGEDTPSEYEFCFVDSKKNIRNIYVKVGIIPGTSKTVASLLDITDRKKTEKKLRASGKRFRELAELLPETVFETDKDMNLTYVNQQAFSMFGYSRKDFENRLNALDMLIADDRKRGRENVQKRFQNLEIGVSEYQGLKKDGSTFPILLHASPFIENGKVVGLRGIIIDLTERKKIEEHLRIAQKLEAIGTLAGGISHNFNNILQSLLGYTELSLLEVEKNSVLENYLQQIYRSGQRAKNLVKQLLEFSQQSDERISPIQVNNLVKGIVKLISSLAPATIKIRDQITSDSFIMGNPNQFHMILMNICSNAIQAMKANGGVLEIELKDIQLSKDNQLININLNEGEYLELTVRDTGVGIDPDIIDSIFDPYFTTKQPGEATGMGLSMVHGIIESYDGVITVDSELGKGATFRIYLPVVKKPSVGEFFNKRNLLPGTEKILFVDDKKPIVKMNAQALERLGYGVTALNSGIDALEVFQADPESFDLIITDMTMPMMTGDRLAQEIKKIRPNVPVILCTGFNEKISFRSPDSLGIDAVLMKPVCEIELSKTIRQLLDGPEPIPR